MNAGTTALLLIVIVGMGAIIAQLKRKRAVAIGLVVLLGILAGNAPGPIGDWTESAAEWLFDLPADVNRVIN